MNEFVKSHGDFQDVIDDVDDIRSSLTVQEVILNSDVGPALMYELAKNRDEFERINNLSPLAAARELGKLEARLQSSHEETAPKETKKTTNAPAPLRPVGSKAASHVDADALDFQAWKKSRMAGKIN